MPDSREVFDTCAEMTLKQEGKLDYEEFLQMLLQILSKFSNLDDSSDD